MDLLRFPSFSLQNNWEKYKPYHILGFKDAFNWKPSETATFNKKTGIVGLFRNFCLRQDNKFWPLKYPIATR